MAAGVVLWVKCTVTNSSPLSPLFVVQVSQYTFAMCSYREKKAEPVELLTLDGYTVDYTDPQPGNTQLGLSNYKQMQSG